MYKMWVVPDNGKNIGDIDMMDINSNVTNTMNGQVRKPSSSEEQALFMRQKSDRMAGSAPEWRSSQSAREESVFRLSEAAQNPDERNDSPYVQSFKGYMLKSVPKDKAFGVGDMVDMVNPLHHLPVLGPLYRNITGDEINPAGRIIGGSIFGGALGAASSIANVISEEETGQDIPGLVVNQMQSDQAHSAYRNHQSTTPGNFDNSYQHDKPQYNE